MAELEGRIVLVTGASRGIGAATARALAAAGAKVIVTDVGTARFEPATSRRPKPRAC